MKDLCRLEKHENCAVQGEFTILKVRRTRQAN